MFAHKYNLKEQELYFFLVFNRYLLKNYNSLKKKKTSRVPKRLLNSFNIEI